MSNRISTPFVSGTITNNPLASGGTSLSSAALASLAAVASPDVAVIILDPAGSAGAPEVVHVTAHTGAATTATIARAKEGTSSREHAAGTPWVHGPTTYDLSPIRIVAADVTGASTTSTSAADVLTISSLSIPTTSGVIIRAMYTLAVDAGSIGLKINATTVLDGTHGGTAIMGGGSEAGVGGLEFYIGPRVAANLYNANGRYWFRGSSAAVATALLPTGAAAWTAALPNAAITSIIFRGDVAAGATLTITNVVIYEVKQALG